MHLTNYSLNKHSDDFVQNQDADNMNEGSKRSIESIMNWLTEHGHDAGAVWADIGLLISKTVIAIQPILAHANRTCFGKDANNNCFEILGFDVLLDHKLKPWLIEVNHSPSFNTDSPMDTKIKGQLIKDSINLANIKSSDLKKYSKELKVGFAARNYTPSSADPSPHSLSEQAADVGRPGLPYSATRAMLSAQERQKKAQERARDLHEEKWRGDFTLMCVACVHAWALCVGTIMSTVLVQNPLSTQQKRFMPMRY
jgi:hypothetical protein